MLKRYEPKKGGGTPFYYGYVIVFASFIVMTMTFGIHYSFGVFFKPLMTEFGWTRAETSAAYSIMTLFSGLFGILAGRIGDFFGPRIIGTFAGVFLCVGFLLLSLANQLWHFYLFYGLVMAAGVGGCWPGLMPAVAKWFTRRRGLMSGIVASGIGFGTIIIPSLAEWLISNYDWRTAYIIIGCFTLILVIGVSQFLKGSPKKIGEPADCEGDRDKGHPYPEITGHKFSEASRSRPFWLLCGVYYCYGYCLHTIMVHIAPWAQDLGISAGKSAIILAIIGATSVISRIIIGGASDKFGLKPSLIIGLIFMIISLLWVQIAQVPWMFYLFGILFGIAYGGIIALLVLAAAELFGLHSMGVILGTITFAYTLGGATGPIVSGYLFDLLGSYRPAFFIAAFVAIVSISFALVLKLPGRRMQKPKPV